MARHATFTQPVFENIPDGKHAAVIFQMIDLGSQRFSKGDKEWYSPQMLIGFEIPGLTFETNDGDTLSQIKSITAFVSLNPSRQGIGLREIMDGIVGSKDWTDEQLQAFDLDTLLGKSCLIELAGVESKGKVYQNILSVEAFPVGVKPIREQVSVTVDDFKDDAKITALPQWIQDKIAKSKEWQEMYSSPDMPSERNQQQPTFSDSQIAEAKERIREESDEIRVEDVPF
jgi:hypothetical protein